jgi:hypothetical protein
LHEQDLEPTTKTDEPEQESDQDSVLDINQVPKLKVINKYQKFLGKWFERV